MTILLKEKYGKTAEFLMSRSLGRGEILVSKLALALMNILILNLAAGITGFASLIVFRSGHISIQPFLVMTLYAILLNLFFGAVGVIALLVYISGSLYGRKISLTEQQVY